MAAVGMGRHAHEEAIPAEELQSQNYVTGGGYGSARDYGYQRTGIWDDGSGSAARHDAYASGTWGHGACAGYEPDARRDSGHRREAGINRF